MALRALLALSFLGSLALARAASLRGFAGEVSEDEEEAFYRAFPHLSSFGYESPPPPEFAHFLAYTPPPETGTEKHERQALYEAVGHMELVEASHGPRRNLQGGRAADWARALAPSPEAMILKQNQKFAPAPGPSPDCLVRNTNASSPIPIYNATISSDQARELRYLVWQSMQQPQYPSTTEVSATIRNITVMNELQEFGTMPRYSRRYGIAVKHSSGRWMTVVTDTNWWWGADDWSTALWTCRYYQPGPNGYDCEYDRTCPGCDRCRGVHCFYNWNKRTYCGDATCSGPAQAVKWKALECVQQPVYCGVSSRVGTASDIGFPGFGGP